MTDELKKEWLRRNEEVLLSIIRAANIPEDEAIKRIKKYRNPNLHLICGFFLAIGRFPTELEYEAIQAVGVQPIIKLVSPNIREYLCQLN